MLLRFSLAAICFIVLCSAVAHGKGIGGRRDQTGRRDPAGAAIDKDEIARDSRRAERNPRPSDDGGPITDEMKLKMREQMKARRAQRESESDKEGQPLGDEARKGPITDEMKRKMKDDWEARRAQRKSDPAAGRKQLDADTILEKKMEMRERELQKRGTNVPAFTGRNPAKRPTSSGQKARKQRSASRGNPAKIGNRVSKEQVGAKSPFSAAEKESKTAMKNKMGSMKNRVEQKSSRPNVFSILGIDLNIKEDLVKQRAQKQNKKGSA